MCTIQERGGPCGLRLRFRGRRCIVHTTVAKDRRFDMRLGEDELVLFRAAATREGLKLAEWLRQAGLDRVRTAEYKEPARLLGVGEAQAPDAPPSTPSSSEPCEHPCHWPSFEYSPLSECPSCHGEAGPL